jgi:glycerol-3-phosphate acyltransferase PlsY
MMAFLFMFLSAYLIGSVNFSIFLFHILKKEDPRKHGSGNAGATNVYRQAGLGWALAVLILDMGRAVLLAVLSMYLLNSGYVAWVGFGLIMGNRFPCFHKFKGGKGVANYLGFTVAISPVAALISAFGWAMVFLIFRIPFISSFLMVLILAGGTIISYEYDPGAVSGAVATAVLIYWSHKRNIIELMKNPNNPGAE